MHVCASVCVTLRIIESVCVCVCVAARLREINTRYDRKMKALLWVTTEHRGRAGTDTHTYTHTHAHTHIHIYTDTHTYISPSCLLVVWVQ